MDTQAASGGGQIYTLLPKVMNDIGAVGKARRADIPGGAKYAFRGIDDLYNAVQPALIKQGVTIAPIGMTIAKRDTIERQGKGPLFYTLLSATYRFYAPDGSYVEATTIGEAMDSGDKGCNKAMSAAMKYAMFQVLCIPTEEPKDTENETHELPEGTNADLSPNGEIPPVAESAIKALAMKWAKITGLNGYTKADKPAFVTFVQKACKTNIDMGNPNNWHPANVDRVALALQALADDTEAAKAGAR